MDRPALESERDIPAPGGWRPGDPKAWRQFAAVARSWPFALEAGGRLDEVTVAYETWGTLDAVRSNAVLVCHALTGDAHAAGETAPGQRSEGWWNSLIGPGLALDTDRYFVVCANVLGGCQGTTGPLSPHPVDGRPWGGRFPVVTVRDTVRMQAMLADHLGIKTWLSVVGGSMGGMPPLEWPIMFPGRVASVVSIASAAAASPLQIGWSQAGRLAIVQDPAWNGGDYYDAKPGHGPHEGLMLARRIAQIHYRSDQSFLDRFGRAAVGPGTPFGMWERFQIESYLDYHGQKLARRFDATSYLVLNKAMDLHDVGRGRGGTAAALRRVRVPSLVVSIDSDMLYPPALQKEVVDGLRAAGTEVQHETVISDHGHDGFLIEFDQLAPMLDQFLTEQLKASVRVGGGGA